MDAEAARKQLEELRKELASTYVLMITILARLPIPMLLPQRQADDPSGVLRSLSLAWELIGAEPIDSLARARIKVMLVEWPAAYELAVVANGFGPAPWRLRAVEAALARVRLSADRINGQRTSWLR